MCRRTSSGSPTCPISPWNDECGYAICIGVLRELRDACPFNTYLHEQGFVGDFTVGSFVEDMTPTSVLCAGGVHARAQGFASSRVKMLPEGLDGITHYALAAALESPLAAEVPMALDLEFSVDTIIAAKADIATWRAKQWRVLKRGWFKLGDLRQFLDAQRSVTSLTVSPHLDLMVNEALRYSLR